MEKNISKKDADTLDQIIDLIIKKFSFTYYAGEYRKTINEAEVSTTSAYAREKFAVSSADDFEKNINHIFETLKNLDPEIIAGVLNTLFQNFDSIVKKEQKAFCERRYHDFSKWKKGSKNIPIFDSDDNIIDFVQVDGLEYRVCKNCGMIQIPGSLEEKKSMTEENNQARRRTKLQER